MNCDPLGLAWKGQAIDGTNVVHCVHGLAARRADAKLPANNRNNATPPPLCSCQRSMSATYGMSGIDPLGCVGRCSQDARTDRMMSTSIPRATLGSTVARMFPRLLPRVVPPGPTPFFDPAIVHYEVVENNENNTRHVLDQAVAAVGCPLLRTSGRRRNHECQLPW